ncbi:MAG: hypothetical protein K6C08_09700 [Oscillospiraceae bacterium]|nr:hypothetical protein [Oscillospiraceae bacterium]
MARKRKSRASAVGTVFYIIILILWIAVLAAGSLYILKEVWDYASVYDDAQPDPVMDAYIASLRENLWDDSIASTVAAMPHEMQTDEEVAALVKEMLTQDELSYQLNHTNTRSDRRCYDILCGSNIFGEVYLEEDISRNLVADISLPSQVIGILARIGVAIQPELYSWQVASESYDFSGLYSGVRITVPKNYQVALNGRVLGEEYIVETDIPYDVLEHYYYRYDNLPTKVTYEFSHIMGHIEPVIYDESGNIFVVDKDRDDSQYIQPADEYTRSELQTFLDGFVDAYLHFSAGTMEANAGYNLVLPYIEAGSELDEKLKQVMLIGDYSHNSSYQYYGSELLNAVALGENFYLTEITASASAIQPVGAVEISRTFRILVDSSSGRMVAATIDDI